jgi:hypothetical protein
VVVFDLSFVIFLVLCCDFRGFDVRRWRLHGLLNVLRGGGLGSFRNYMDFVDGTRVLGWLWKWFGFRLRLGLAGGGRLVIEAGSLEGLEFAHGAVVGAVGGGDIALDGVPGTVAVFFAEAEGDPEERVLVVVVGDGDMLGHIADLEVEEGGFDGEHAIAPPSGVDEAVDEVAFGGSMGQKRLR